jgi:hypothetical protein
MCYFSSSHGIKPDFLGEGTPALGNKTAKLAESPETNAQRNILRGCDP